MTSDRRSSWRGPLLALGVASWGCEPPDDALVHGCTRSALELTTPCYVRAKRLDKDQAATFDAHTKNERVRVRATIRVGRGELAVELPGCAEGKGVARPDRPLVLACDSKVSRHGFTFSLWARPRSTEVESVEGEITFRPI